MCFAAGVGAVVVGVEAGAGTAVAGVAGVSCVLGLS